jgi:hypothetical protein
MDQNVIKEDQHEPIEEGSEDVVHQHLECGQRIGEVEGHHEELKVVVVGMECRLLEVPRVHPYLAIAGPQV